VAHELHRAHVTLAVGKDLDRGRKVDELHAFALGLRELFLVHDHFVAAAPVHDVDLLGAQPPRGGGAVHRGVATAEHHDALTHLARTPPIRAPEDHDSPPDAVRIPARAARI